MIFMDRGIQRKFGLFYQSISFDRESQGMQDIRNDKALLIDRLRNPKTGMLNLREFRDQLLGRRAIKPILVSWGLYDGGRLGIKAKIEGKSKLLNHFRNQRKENRRDQSRTSRRRG